MSEPTKGTEVAVAEKKMTKAPILGGKGGLQLATLDDYWRFAEFVVSAKMCPSGMDNAAAVVIGLQLGAELGLAPMQSLQNIAVINNRPSIWGDAAKALVETSGLCEEFDEWFEGEPFKDKFKAICEVRRVGREKPVRWEFTVEDAKLAGLWGKKGPWSQYPKRMLQMRARGFTCRDAFPDVLKGLRLAEEIRDIEAIDVTPKEPGDSPKSIEDLKVEMKGTPADGKHDGNCDGCGRPGDIEGSYLNLEWIQNNGYCSGCLKDEFVPEPESPEPKEFTDEEKAAIVEAENAEHEENAKKEKKT